jgi:outer membrane protein TolC
MKGHTATAPTPAAGLALAVALLALAARPAPAAESPSPTAPAEEVLELPAVKLGHPPARAPGELPFAGVSELSAEALVQQVLARNPTLAQMAAAWQAARARYPQVTSLEDPMFEGTIGPGTISPDDPGVELAYRLEVSQKFPFPGKRQLRGQNALAEASAAGHDVEDTKLQLVESARDAFFDYYLVGRALAVNEEALALLERLRKAAQVRYETVKGANYQDVLQAKVEIGRQRERLLTLGRQRQVAVARINTLLHLPPDSSLPPPPEDAGTAAPLPDVRQLRAQALSARPDLLALADHIRAEEAMLGLAHKEFCPDFEPFFMYDRFMGNTTDNRDLAAMLGVRMNLPVYREKRYAAVSEAAARVAGRRAEFARQADQVAFQVQEAYEQVRESERIAELYRDTILPDAARNVEEARTAYETGRIPFVTLVEAEHAVVMLRDRYYEAVADQFRRRAMLERAVGGSLEPLPPLSGLPPAPGHPLPAH